MLNVLKRCYSTATPAIKRTASELIEIKHILNRSRHAGKEPESRFCKLFGMHQPVGRLKLETKELNNILNNVSSDLSKLKYDDLFHNSENNTSSSLIEKLDNKLEVLSKMRSSKVNAMEITRSLPLEIQCLVLKHAIFSNI
ncbi:unnamed protein product [Ambrosiozyma monospora]|uniref:Unnamed protein product n=1 Tax=Ambrosiozyma monospora TaxID=43982 RepID=A0ACB5T8T3_AMBMO|nr:unnamed protein product [Ambrosiozyma monospora]